MTRVIKVAEEFSRFPGGRYIADGPASGEEFRNTLLVPALRDADKVVVDMNGVAGYAASFLEEAFGGAVVELGYDFVRQKLEVSISDDPNLKYAVSAFMEKASHA